ncbi:MAG: hypothetical protein HC788_01655 [Sphingopyxis sp.]|nr:hypothetical protein [Sphingopyxis sp.]
MMLVEAIKLAASLVAIFGIAWLVRGMKLGGEARIRDAAHALQLADEAEVGFGGTDVGLDRAGYAALVRNAEGRQLLIRAHGTQFAARDVDAGFTGRLDKDFLTLTAPERRFGSVTLQLGKDAGLWASRMREVPRG